MNAQCAEKEKEDASDVVLSFFYGLIGCIAVAGMMLTLIVGAYWYMYPMLCNFEASGSISPELSGYLSASSDGTSNISSDLLAMNYSRNGTSSTTAQLTGSLDTNGHISGQVYCRDVELVLREYAANMACKHARENCLNEYQTSYNECIKAACR